MLLLKNSHNLELKNLGIVTHIDTGMKNMFKLFFMGLIREFQKFHRLVICIDASYLNGKHLGTLFIVVAKDNDNQTYPLTFSIKDKEGIEIWSLFLRYLCICISVVPNLAILSNRHNSIIVSVVKIMSHVIHGFCNYHIKDNMQTQSNQTKHIQILFWIGVSKKNGPKPKS